jgi:hypothetical protein
LLLLPGCSLGAESSLLAVGEIDAEVVVLLRSAADRGTFEATAVPLAPLLLPELADHLFPHGVRMTAERGFRAPCSFGWTRPLNDGHSPACCVRETNDGRRGIDVMRGLASRVRDLAAGKAGATA